MYYLKTTKEMGRGLYAATGGIGQGKIIAECELLVLNEQDTRTLETTGLKHYTFKFNETQDCLVLGDGEIFNHSINPNVGYKLWDKGDRLTMVFFALRDIDHNEQLFIDYNADTTVVIEEYLKTRSLL